MKTTIRAVIIALVLISCVTRSWAAPCSSVLMATRPCDLSVGQPAPYAGVLMTETTANDLIAAKFAVKRLTIQLAGADETLSLKDKRILDLEVALEDAPGPMINSPWFWLAIIGAGALGVWGGSQL